MKKLYLVFAILLLLIFGITASISWAMTTELPTYRRLPMPQLRVMPSPIVVRSPGPTPAPLVGVCTQTGVTFAKVKSDLQSLLSAGKLTQNIYIFFLTQIQQAEASYILGNIANAQIILEQLKQQVNLIYQYAGITKDVAVFLLDDITCLKDSLQIGAGV